MAEPTVEQRQFLLLLSHGLRLPLADRKEDRVRQSCRRAGWAVVVMNPRRWTLTDAGRAVLAETRHG